PAGISLGPRLKTAFFPTDLSYLSYVDIWLPENATLEATDEAARIADRIVREVAAEHGKKTHREVLRSVTTFIGGGAPRFWFSLPPQQDQVNYAQLVVEVTDDHDTTDLVAPLQRALSAQVPGALIDVRQLETGKPVNNPLEVRISGDDIQTLRDLSRRAQAIFRDIPIADRVRDDWGTETPRIALQVDPERARLAGVSNREVAASTNALTGIGLGRLRDGEQQMLVFRESGVVALLSVLAILLSLVIQFRSAVKPLIVLAAIPFGGVGAILALVITRAPFGFTAVLGIISLIGVIVSHVIVLF